MFKQAVPRIGLSLESETPDVPADGHYYVVVNGEIVFRSPKKSEALKRYQAVRDDLLVQTPPGNEESPSGEDRAEALRKARAADLRPVRQPNYKAKLRVGGRRGHR